MKNENWNDDWREELKNNYPTIYERLCDCDNKKSDIEVIAILMQKYNILLYRLANRMLN